MNIEKATNDSLGEIYRIIRNSIINLCAADHSNEKGNLENWLAARSPENLEKLLFDGKSQAFVCIENEKVIGVSHIKKDGELTLCYVHSEYAGKGIGRIILEAAEKQADIWKLEEINLISTATAKRFYLAQGFEENGAPISYFGMPGFPLKKALPT